MDGISDKAQKDAALLKSGEDTVVTDGSDYLCDCVEKLLKMSPVLSSEKAKETCIIYRDEWEPHFIKAKSIS